LTPRFYKSPKTERYLFYTVLDNTAIRVIMELIEGV